MTYSTKFKWSNNAVNRPKLFGDKYITALSRIPNIGEHISFTGHPIPYTVVDIITELKGWDDYYIIVLE